MPEKGKKYGNQGDHRLGDGPGECLRKNVHSQLAFDPKLRWRIDPVEQRRSS